MKLDTLPVDALGRDPQAARRLSRDGRRQQDQGQQGRHEAVVSSRHHAWISGRRRPAVKRVRWCLPLLLACATAAGVCEKTGAVNGSRSSLAAYSNESNGSNSGNGSIEDFCWLLTSSM